MRLLELYQRFDELQDPGAAQLGKSDELSTPAGIAKWLQDRGFKPMGAGASATVYGRDGYENVIKIMTGTANFSKGSVSMENEHNRCNLQFYRKAMQNQGNPHYPKIHMAKTITDPETGRVGYFILMEKLYPLEGARSDGTGGGKDFLASMDDGTPETMVLAIELAHRVGLDSDVTPRDENLEHAIMLSTQMQRVVFRIINDDATAEAHRHFGEDISKWPPKAWGFIAEWLTSKMEYELYDTLWADVVRTLPFARLSNELFNSGCYVDLHDENIMKRKDGTLVISDPVAG
jgi:hypothetical protein